jgi:cyclohexanecarboxyl-CoA dehydrogenase
MVHTNEDPALLESLRDAASRFAREKLLPRYQAREVDAKYDRGLLREMGRLGLIAPELPEALGGLGLSHTACGLITEQIAYGDFNVSYVQVFGSLLGHVISRNANPELGKHWVSRIAAGDALVAIALTEPGGGSDVANLSTRAVRSGQHYLISGEKTSISGAVQADAFVVFARTGKKEDGHRGISAFLVPAETPGITRTQFEDVGTKIVGRGSVFFDEVRVPLENMLGEESQGFSHVMQGLDFSRVLIALQCIGAAQASIDETWQYVTQRKAFGGTISQFQGVTFPLAEGEAQIAAVRQLSYHALALGDQGKKHTVETAMVKMMGPKNAFDVIHTCVLLHGHYGYSLDLPHQQRLRDVMGLELGDGTEQIMKKIITRERVNDQGRRSA